MLGKKFTWMESFSTIFAPIFVIAKVKKDHQAAHRSEINWGKNLLVKNIQNNVFQTKLKSIKSNLCFFDISMYTSDKRDIDQKRMISTLTTVRFDTKMSLPTQSIVAKN